MQAVRDEDMRLHAVLADVRLLGIEDQVLQLGVPEGYDWHKEMVTKSVGLLERLGSGIWGAKLQMKCTVGAAKAPRSNEEEHEQLIKRASGLFAGDIVE